MGMSGDHQTELHKLILIFNGYLQGGIKRSTQAMNTGKYPTHLQLLSSNVNNLLCALHHVV